MEYDTPLKTVSDGRGEKCFWLSSHSDYRLIMTPVAWIALGHGGQSAEDRQSAQDLGAMDEALSTGPRLFGSPGSLEQMLLFTLH